ncbi:MAG: hypothetical protein ABIH86_03970 [Planctomycetota bacterium]
MKLIRNQQDIESYSVSAKIVARIGAFVAKGLTLSSGVLDALVSGNEKLEALLLDTKLLRKAKTADQSLIDELLEKYDPGADTIPPLRAAITPDGGLALCLDEEHASESGWGVAGETPSSTVAPSPSARAMPLAASQRNAIDTATASGDAAGADIPGEFDRQKLLLFASADAPRRIEALRRIAWLGVDNQLKGDLFLRALGDEATSVRIEAAKLLVPLGFDRDIADIIIGLNAPDKTARENSAARLGTVAKRAGDLETGAIALTALARLKEETETELRRALIQSLTGFAPMLAEKEDRVREISRLIFVLFAYHPDELWHPMYDLMNRFSDAQPDLMREIFWSELDKTVRRDMEAFLLNRLSVLARRFPDDRERLADKCAGYIATDKESGRDSRLVGASLMSLRADGARAIQRAYQYASDDSRKYMLTLLDDHIRFAEPDAQTVGIGADLLLDALEVGRRTVRISALGLMIPTHPLCPADKAERLADALFQHIDDLTFRSDIENAELVIARIGLPAVKPLLDTINAGTQTERQSRAIRILGELSRRLKVHGRSSNAADAKNTLDDILRRLQALSMKGDFPALGDVWVAMGKTASTAAMTSDVIEIVAGHLTKKATDQSLPDRYRAVEGLSWLATSRKVKRALVEQTRDLLTELMDAKKPDLKSETTIVDEEPVFVIDEGIEIYTDSLPVAIDGLTRVALAPNAGERIPREIATSLIDWWKRLVSGKEVWGPANMTNVADSLRDLGASSKLSTALRIEILKALAKRIRQMTVLTGMVEILVADDSPMTTYIAIAVLKEILTWRDQEGMFDDDDREYIYYAIGTLLKRKEWKGEDTVPRLRANALEQLSHALQDDVKGVYNVMVSLRDAHTLPETFQKRLEDRLTRYGAIVSV